MHPARHTDFRHRLLSTGPSLQALLATALHSLSLFWVVSLLARFCPPAAVGDYVFGFAVAAPVFMFLALRLRIVLANDTEPVDRTWPFFTFRAITCTFALLIVGTISLLFLGLSDRSVMVILVGAIKAAEAMSDICHGGLQRLQTMPVVCRSITLRALGTLAVTSIVIPMTGSASMGAGALLLVWAMTFLLDFKRLRLRCPAKPVHVLSMQDFWQTAHYFSALGFTSLLVAVSFNMPRFFLAAYSPASDLGYYGAIAYFGMVIGMIANALAESTIPGITREHRNDLRSTAYLNQVRRLYGWIVGLGLAGVLLSLVWGEAALTLLFGTAYATHTQAFIIIQFAGIFTALAMCQAHVVISLGQSRAQLIAAAASLALLLVACTYWVPHWNIQGAACADLLYSVIYFAWVEWIIRTTPSRSTVT